MHINKSPRQPSASAAVITVLAKLSEAFYAIVLVASLTSIGVILAWRC